MKKIYIVLGFVFVGIGAIGVALPILPTTPFLLLASFFFSKGSKRFEDWFRSTRLYKTHLEEFLTNRAMTRKTKVSLLSVATTVLLLSAFMVKILAFRVAIALLVVYMYYYFIFRIRTIRGEKSGEVRVAQQEGIG